MTKILLDTGPSPRSLWRLAAFLRCPQLYAYNYVLGLTESPTEPLVRGSIGHCGLAHLYAREMMKAKGLDPDIFYEPIEAMHLAAERWGMVGADMLKVVLEVYPTYVEKYAVIDLERYETLSVEQAFDITITLPNGETYTYTQRPDWVARERATGLGVIFDHKFLGSTTPSSLARYAPTIQFASYRKLGPLLFPNNFGGVYINAVHCGEDRRHVRSRVDAAPHLVAHFEQIVQDAEEGILKLTVDKRDGWNYPKVASDVVCYTPYGACPELDRCLWGNKEPAVDMAKFDVSHMDPTKRFSSKLPVVP